ncbi:hypothetical protein EJ08DRAFT_607448 [Tothia fuscella]|uniref:F-box domain-containing protein n=1 Tax=Tothia fuscella TaxID=1048955 RepID=A0A9P4NXX0_9PEZI|nr:hypothetical protein EJ08DRAFT_607448 [Tothia fuscella]
MRKEEIIGEGEDPLVDTTAAIPLNSKRTQRQKKKQQKKDKAHKELATLLDLPSELFMTVLGYSRPSDVFVLSRVSKDLREFILYQEATITREIIDCRYLALSKCFPLPIPLERVDKNVHPAMLSEERQTMLNLHKKPYQHIKPPDPQALCTCLTCMLAWNNLCLVVDFAFWQGNLDRGEPITIIARGKYPEWNQKLVSDNATIVTKALDSPLYYARLLEEHLRSTINSARRHGNNKGNKRRRFRMTSDDAASETDCFLERSGPPSMDFPFHRDNYYMLEAYLPNRGWNQEQQRWMYIPASQHDRDVEHVKAWAARRNFGQMRPRGE